MKRIVISDCEGPISKNDNAFELTSHFVPDGDILFTVISRYDDVLSDVLKRPDYRAGNTLKLVLPFLKAFEVTDEKMQSFSAASLVLIESAKSTMNYISEISHAFIVSTSYEHYVKALCQFMDFPYENTFCTSLSLDKYHTSEDEKAALKNIAKEIAHMPIVEIPHGARSLEDFPEEDQKELQRLDRIFWHEIKCLDCGRMYSEVNPVGGEEKVQAIKYVAAKLKTASAEIMYVGDSITDKEALKFVKDSGGLAVSFNGNQYAVENSEVAILSENSIVTAVIADSFCRFGKNYALHLVENWGRRALDESAVDHKLVDSLYSSFPHVLPKAKITSKENMENLSRESSEFRKRVRGKTIGRLG